jgi:hypothetical protein
MPAVASFVIVRCGLLKGLNAAIRFAAAGVMRFAFAAAITMPAIFLAMTFSPWRRMVTDAGGAPKRRGRFVVTAHNPSSRRSTRPLGGAVLTAVLI